MVGELALVRKADFRSDHRQDRSPPPCRSCTCFAHEASGRFYQLLELLGVGAVAVRGLRTGENQTSTRSSASGFRAAREHAQAGVDP